MITRHATRPVLLALAALLAGVGVAGASEAPQAEHAHDAGTAAVASLKLDGEARWQTDAALRTGMAAIHAAFEGDHPAIHDGRQSDAQYDALAERIEKQVDVIVANCKLPAAADANLHYVIADLLRGATLMRGRDPQRSRHDGAALVHGALRAYGQFFDDPGWEK
jgi:hypothetical protein